MKELRRPSSCSSILINPYPAEATQRFFADYVHQDQTAKNVQSDLGSKMSDNVIFCPPDEKSLKCQYLNYYYRLEGFILFILAGQGLPSFLNDMGLDLSSLRAIRHISGDWVIYLSAFTRNLISTYILHSSPENRPIYRIRSQQKKDNMTFNMPSNSL